MGRSVKQILRERELRTTQQTKGVDTNTPKASLNQQQKKEILDCIGDIAKKINALISVIPETMEEGYINHRWTIGHNNSTCKKIRGAKNNAALSVANLYDKSVEYEIGSTLFKRELGLLSKELGEKSVSNLKKTDVNDFSKKLTKHTIPVLQQACS